MSDRAFVDTNILMYAHDSTAGAKHETARMLVEELWRTRSGILSTQVIQELCVNLRRKTRLQLETAKVREIVTTYLAWELYINTGLSVLEALDIESRYRISFWDALIVQAASASGATILYSEDLSDGQAYGSVRVVNPLTIKN